MDRQVKERSCERGSGRTGEDEGGGGPEEPEERGGGVHGLRHACKHSLELELEVDLRFWLGLRLELAQGGNLDRSSCERRSGRCEEL